MKKAQATMSAIKNGDRKSTRLNSSHTVIYTLSLHVALPIFVVKAARHLWKRRRDHRPVELFHEKGAGHDERDKERRSEEHTSELQSHSDLHSFPTRRSSDLCRESCAPFVEAPSRSPSRRAVP